VVKGRTIGIDATTLEANAALRSIVRRDSGESYEEFLTQLAKASGIGTPTRADLARIDRKRKKRGSNDDWTHPHDPDAKITKMKDGRTHLAHKAEHAIDLETGAIVGVTVQAADKGDTTTIHETLPEAAEQLEAVAAVTDDVVARRSSPTRATTVEPSCTISRRWRFARTSANPIAGPSRGSIKRRNATRCMRIAVASAATVGNASYGNEANCSSDRARISMRPVGCGARTCADTRTYSSGDSCTPARSISDCGCGRSSASARRAVSRAVWSRFTLCSARCGASCTPRSGGLAVRRSVWAASMRRLDAFAV
jgi:hypothetical protein